MVEGVEGFEPQFELHPFSQVDGLEQGHVEVQQSWSNNCVSAGISEPMVRSAGPLGSWCGKRSLVKPAIW
jgi:hypothetical protein